MQPFYNLICDEQTSYVCRNVQDIYVIYVFTCTHSTRVHTDIQTGTHTFFDTSFYQAVCKDTLGRLGVDKGAIYSKCQPF